MLQVSTKSDIELQVRDHSARLAKRINRFCAKLNTQTRLSAKGSDQDLCPNCPVQQPGDELMTRVLEIFV